ncbi:MAG: di-trans,poly-cis-decaprenylcistransferase [Candidatus Staskawiczbacteria bacterium]|nr:di-trans,poly-cis-decaprenylcistransferase [Candidatus Staskawiczbacteria bacterium]
MTHVPQHIVVFPDGNRRWAKDHNLSIEEGYLEGEKRFADFLQLSKSSGVKVVTVFGFSTENWSRPLAQVAFLMNIFEKSLSRDLDGFMKEGIRVRVIGEREKLSNSLKKAVENVETTTENNSAMHLNLAVSYGGKWDILQATKKIISENIPLEKVTEELFEQYLSTAGQPAPDLVIRAGGEKRLSNFVLWQAAYAELYFSPKMWPDFSQEDFNLALEEFDSRSRRFGK